MVSYSKVALVSLVVPVTTLLAYEDTCAPFPDIYANGTELCEVMWGDAFEVVDDESAGYTMWFFDHENNPNDAMTRKLFGEEKTVDTCHLDYFHKDTPSAEGDGMTECHPWKNNACCDKTTVPSVNQININYGDGYEWDRCGPMSQACERFFVMESCFYECEPAAGLFRKYNDSQKDEKGFNKWQMSKMPIKKSFCNAWYDACRADYFCDKGDFFSCKAYYEKNLKEKEQEMLQEKETKGKEPFLIGILVASALAIVGTLVSLCLVWKEKQGTPYFTAPGGVRGVSA